MSKDALVFLNVQIVGDEVDPINIVPTFVSNTNSPATHSIIALTNGNTTITPPSTALFALLVPISGAVVNKTFKGVTGDTGYPISITQPILISLAASAGTFVILADGLEDLDAYFF